MKYPAYPKYKDSGVAWLGAVPVAWEVKRLSYLALLKSGENITSEQIAEGGDYPVYGGNGLRGFYSSYTHEGFYALIGRQGALCGNVNYANGKFWASEHAIVVTPITSFASKWLGELLRAMNLNQYSVSAAQPGLSVSMIASLKIPVPSCPEQTAIAAFLDSETGRIDTLVAKKRKLAALLKEKRSGLISRTVTRGLPDDTAREFGLTTGNASIHEAPDQYNCRGDFNRPQAEANKFAPTSKSAPSQAFKDSGVEWLGEIPVHWRLAQIKYVAQVRQGVTKGRDLVGKETIELSYLRVANVQDGYLDLANISTIPVLENEIQRYSLKKGDVLMNEGGDNDKLGRGTVWNEEIAVCLHQNHVFSVRPFDISLSAWIALWTQGAAAKSYFLLRGKQTTNLASISSTSIRELPIIIPPIAEQTAIASYLDRETAKIDRLVEKVETAIARLQEYRSALITAAVTGKIDVRAYSTTKVTR